MTRYAVGDLQGCLKPLQCLLAQVEFDPAHDQLWLVGDLINRGPDSLATLRFLQQLGDCTRIVLGNHDLHFLAINFGVTQPGKADTLAPLLAAADREQLVHWLLQQGLFYSDPSDDFHMVHAGIPPQWSLAETIGYAREVEAVLQSDKPEQFFQQMYGNQPDCWSDQLSGPARWRVITNYLTRMRFCTASGQLDFSNKLDTYSGPNADQFAPWFAHPQRLTRNDNILFGHWAALRGHTDTEHVFALDTGCVWGHAMTMMNLEQQKLYSCQCQVP